jgi:hypothetical protein
MITTILALFASAALAGQPGGTGRQVAPTAPRAPAVAAQAPAPEIPRVQNAPLGRPAFDLASACPGLTTAYPQQMRPDTATALQAGSTEALVACGQFARAQAQAFSQQTLATAGAALVNPVETKTTSPDGTVITTKPVADAPTYEFARVDAARGTVTVANGPAATWAAASNGGQVFPMGAMGWGTNGAWGPMMGASAAINAGVGQPTPIAMAPAAAAPRAPTRPAAAPPPAAKPAAPTPPTPPPAAPETDPPEVTRALLEG